MPLVNYCRKCKAEVPLGEACVYCGGKLAKNGEQISFGLVSAPLRDWFAWNGVLRIALPVWILVLAIVLAAEGSASGEAGMIVLLTQGFGRLMLWLLAAVLGVCVLLFWLQGREKVHVILDRQGVHMRTYLPEGSRLQLYARLITPQAAEPLAQQDERPALEGLMLVRRCFVPWEKVRRVRIWREGSVILFFHPAYWQACAVRCPRSELAEAEAFVRKKLKSHKKVRIIPAIVEQKKKKR